MVAVWNSFEIVRPAWIWIGLLLAAWVIWSYRVSLVDRSIKQRRASLAIRLLVLLLATLAAAGLTWYRTTTKPFLILAVDRSASIDATARARADAVVRQFVSASPPDKVMVLPFAGVAGAGEVTDWGETPQPQVARSRGVSPQPQAARDWGVSPQSLDPFATDLAAAVTAARSAVPSGFTPHVVLITDGLPTRGDLPAAVATADMPVSVVLLPDRSQPEIQVGELIAPAQVRVGEPFYLEIVLATNVADQAELTLYRDDLRVDLGTSGQVQLLPGENRLRIRQQLDRPQAALYTARVSAVQDTQLDDNTAAALVIVTGQPRVLLVDQQPESLDPLRWALEDQQMSVEVVVPERLGSSPAELLANDVIVLADVPAAMLTHDQQQWLRWFVEEQGGGLVMLGSEHSFGLGGYDQSPLAQVLPVRSDGKRERETPSLALVLVIDRSGSMGGMKLELAKDAARAAVERLGPRDQIGVVAFDDEAHWVSPLGSAADRTGVAERISRLSSAGGTNLYPGLSQALDALRATTARYKHVIVLSDGISAPADFERLVAEMAAERITVSTVAVGDQADRQRLQSIAAQGAGRFYQCDDPRSVPQIFVQEASIAGKSALNEEPFLPQLVRSTAVMRGIDLAAAPPLLGYVITDPQPTAEVILTTEQGDPLLAWWRFGLGMAMAFTSDAKGRWAADWLTWPDFAPFWAQAIRHVMPPASSDRGQLQLTRHGDLSRATLDLLDDQDAFINRAHVLLTVRGPDATLPPRELTMAQLAPGRYVAQFDSRQSGPYLLSVVASRDNDVLFHQSLGLHVGYPDELRLRPPSITMLEQVVQQTGGLWNPTAEEAMSLEPGPARSWSHAGQPLPLWRGLIVGVLLLWLLDVALRRLELFTV